MTASGLRVTAWATIVAPLLLAGSTLAYLANGDGLSSGELAGAVQLWAFVAFGVAVVGLARLLEAHLPRTAAALTVLGIVGVAGGAAYGIDSIQVAFLDPTVELGESAVAPLALRIPGLAFPLTLLVLGVLLARRRLVSPPAGWALAIGGVLFPPARIGDVAGLAVAGDLLLVVAMVAIGVGLLRGGAPSAGPAAEPSSGGAVVTELVRGEGG